MPSEQEATPRNLAIAVRACTGVCATRTFGGILHDLRERWPDLHEETLQGILSSLVAAGLLKRTAYCGNRYWYGANISDAEHWADAIEIRAC